MDKQSMLKAFESGDEKLLFAKILDLALNCRDKSFSAFIDPVRIQKYINLLTAQKDFNLNFLIFGGNKDSERKMLGLSPNYIELCQDDFPIEAIKVTYNTVYNRKLSHRDYLGSIIALGIDRNRVGDIILADDGCISYISGEISGYIIANLERVGAVKVNVSSFKPIAEEAVRSEGIEKRAILASLRIDSVLSAAFNISRSKSTDMISGEKVFANWVLVKNGSKTVKENDIITLRGYGRVKIKEIAGTTKKERIVAVLYINK